MHNFTDKLCSFYRKCWFYNNCNVYMYTKALHQPRCLRVGDAKLARSSQFRTHTSYNLPQPRTGLLIDFFCFCLQTHKNVTHFLLLQKYQKSAEKLKAAGGKTDWFQHTLISGNNKQQSIPELDYKI